MCPSYLLLQSASGLQPPNWVPVGAKTDAILDQKDYYKNAGGLQPPAGIPWPLAGKFWSKIFLGQKTLG